MNETENLNNIFQQFKIGAICKNYKQYKNVINYDIELMPGTRIQRLEKYLSEIALALKTPTKPKLQILAEQGIVRLECILSKDRKISLFDLGRSLTMPSGKLQCLMGENMRGEPLWLDIAETPHMLIAGTTGSGKSTTLHSIICSLLFNNAQIDLVDPKNIEFCKYANYSNKIRIAFDYSECLSMIKSIYEDMEQRYVVLRGGGKIENYYPFRVLIVDEFADLIMQDHSKDIYSYLCRIVQKSRAAGIHLILATQRPSADIIEGTIKANIPTRMSFKVASAVDARVILGVSGAEDLLGNGDAIIDGSGYYMERFQAAYTNPEEVKYYANGY